VPENCWSLLFYRCLWKRVTDTFLKVFYGKTIHDHHQLCIAQGDASRPGIISGKLKSAFLQALVVKQISGSLPVQQLDLITPLIDKDKDLSSRRVAAKIITHQTRQSIKAFSHIRGMTVQVKSVLCAQCKHRYGFKSRRRTSGLTLSGHMTCMPLGNRKCNWPGKRT